MNDSQESTPSVWQTLMNNADQIKEQQAALRKNIQAAVRHADIPKSALKTLIPELFSQANLSYQDTWLSTIHTIQREFDRMIQVLYHLYHKDMAISVEVTATTVSDEQIITIPMPFRICLPPSELRPNSYKTHPPLAPHAGINITPDMIEVIALRIYHRVECDMDGVSTTEHSVDELTIQFDSDLIDLAVYQFVQNHPDLSDAKSIDINLAQLKADITDQIHEYIRDAENMPTYSACYAVSQLWAFQHWETYSHQAIDDLINSMRTTCHGHL